MAEPVDVLGVLRIERHRLGPRFYLLGRRIHEWHLGLAVLGTVVLGGLAGLLHPSLAVLLAGAAGVWLVAKDWRDLVPSQRDTGCWQLGLHRRAPALRAVRRSDSLPGIAAVVAAAIG